MKNIPEYPDPTDFAGFLIWQKANSWEKFINSRLEVFGLNQGQYLHLVSLCYLLTMQKEVTQATLAEFIKTTAMNTSKVVNKLEKLGLINRKVGKDSRSKALNISPKGQEILISSAQSMSKADQEFFSSSDKPYFIEYLKGVGNT